MVKWPKGKYGKPPNIDDNNTLVSAKGGAVEETDVEVVADLTTDTQGGGNDYDYDSGNWEDSGSWQQSGMDT